MKTKKNKKITFDPESKKSVQEVLDYLIDRDLLTGMDFIRADLTDADFEGSDLAYARLSGVNFKSANFKGANLESAYFGGEEFWRLHFGEAFFSEWADLPGSELEYLIITRRKEE